MIDFLYILKLPVVFTVHGQLIVKWQRSVRVSARSLAKILFLGAILNPDN